MILDLFAGPGGWDVGAEAVGLDGVVGLEWDEAACATRAAAGLTTIRCDVSRLPLNHLPRVTGVIASPPCQAFSNAGKRDGIIDIPHIHAHARSCVTGWHDYRSEGWADVRSAFVLEPLRYALQLTPDWVACEQVPPVLPLWETFAEVLRACGWKTATGILNAADYGVPQTRRRAFLVAHRRFQPTMPDATHAKHPQPTLFGVALQPWVSMAKALGWSTGARAGFPRADDIGDSEDGYRERDWRDGDEPAFALTEKARSWVVQTGNNSHVTSREGSKAGEGGVELYERPIDEPAPTVDAKAGAAWRVTGVNTGRDWKPGGTREDAQVIPIDEPAPTVDGTHAGVGRWWWETRPGTTVQGDTRLWPPGHKPNAEDAAAGRSYSNDRAGTHAIRLQLSDALILQSFASDYPVQGSKTKQFEQVGNAVPPRLAAAVLEQFQQQQPERRAKKAPTYAGPTRDTPPL